MHVAKHYGYAVKQYAHWVKRHQWYLVVLAVVFATLLLAGCQTTPKGATQTVYVAEVVFADAVSGLAAAKSRMNPQVYERAKDAEKRAKSVLYEAEGLARSGNSTGSQVALCTFQSILLELTAYYGGTPSASVCVH